MNKELREIADASKGLVFMSESDHPFEVVELKSNDPEKEIRQLSGKMGDALLEKQTIDYFFRNMVKVYPEYSDGQRTIAERFLKLQELLKQKLKDVQVYRIGSVQIDAFIIGELQDGTYGGLGTKLIET
jgi:hypothetical protein